MSASFLDVNFHCAHDFQFVPFSEIEGNHMKNKSLYERDMREGFKISIVTLVCGTRPTIFIVYSQVGDSDPCGQIESKMYGNLLIKNNIVRRC